MHSPRVASRSHELMLLQSRAWCVRAAGVYRSDRGKAVLRSGAQELGDEIWLVATDFEVPPLAERAECLHRHVLVPHRVT